MDNKTAKFYDRFSILYPIVDLFLKPQKRRLAEEVNALPSGLLLEIGVGNGSQLPLYKKHEIIGIDTSQKMLEIAQQHNRANIQLMEMDGQQLLFPDQTFDYIILSHVIAVVENPDLLLREAHRVLKPNGKILILNHFTPNNWLRYIDHVFSYYSKAFHFKSKFEIDHLIAINLFELNKEISLGYFSYFKLLIYSKK